MEQKKGFCSSCIYWKHTPEQAIKENPRINGAPVLETQVGLCLFMRPATMQVVTQNALGGPQAQMVRVFPQMTENEFCADHPDRLLAREFNLEIARVRARASTTEYDPGRYGDNQAGFNVPPSLEAAKQLAIVADERKPADA